MLRFGTVAPKNSVPHAVVVGLPGLSEYGEKYFETAHTLLDKNLSFWVLDWQGHGLSHRHLKNPHKRHSDGFAEDVEDLHYFIMEYVKHSAVHPDVGRIPLVMLAHSMGANIGLRYLRDHPEVFTCAALLAPLLGVKALSALPFWAARALVKAHCTVLGQQYVYGGGDWRESLRTQYAESPFSSDAGRDAVHNAWKAHNPNLQIGGVTFRWLHEAMNSCAVLRKDGFLESVETPCLVTRSGIEKFVDNREIMRATKRLPNCAFVDFPDARHEILMERDELRNRFFEAFESLIKVHVIDKPETLKPF